MNILAPLFVAGACALCATARPATAQEAVVPQITIAGVSGETGGFTLGGGHTGTALADEHRPAIAGALPTGVVSARLLAGWELPNGSRMTALDLELEKGWKTYWRNPGDGGIPADFDWEGSTNLEAVQIHWPLPEVIDSGGLRSLGYHERLVLPIEVTPHDPDAPIDIALRMDFGLCETICVPGHLILSAPPVGPEPDPLIEAALATAPVPEGEIARCTLSEIRDGLRLSAEVAVEGAQADGAAALEFDGEGVWVSEPDVAVAGGHLTASADFIDESGKPFDLDRSRVRLTLIGENAAWEFEGCL